jgi:uncharacterized membrane protein YphA (DoxX/SURF4 family)
VKKLLTVLLLLGFLSFPHTASAHEVYVLNATQIDHDLHDNSLNLLHAIDSPNSLFWYLFFMFFAITTLTISFFVSFSKWGIKTTKLIEKYSRFAFPIIRVIFGISLIYSGHYHSLFGPELSLSQLHGANIWEGIMYLTGIVVILGLFTRIAAAVLLILFAVSVVTFHEYMLTYINYFGEILVLLIAGGEAFSLDNLIFRHAGLLTSKTAHAITVPILRITFAISLLYAALYVKFIHPALTYNVVMQYHLDKLFHFEPLFVVLGMGCVELVIALLFLLGVNMRWNILFFAFWATLSLLFFGEAVWPHYILFGISIGLFLYGYDNYTLQKWLVTKAKKAQQKS